jgi:hypothetical protein
LRGSQVRPERLNMEVRVRDLTVRVGRRAEDVPSMDGEASRPARQQEGIDPARVVEPFPWRGSLHGAAPGCRRPAPGAFSPRARRRGAGGCGQSGRGHRERAERSSLSSARARGPAEESAGERHPHGGPAAVQPTVRPRRAGRHPRGAPTAPRYVGLGRGLTGVARGRADLRATGVGGRVPHRARWRLRSGPLGRAALHSRAQVCREDISDKSMNLLIDGGKILGLCPAQTASSVRPRRRISTSF